MKVTKSEHRGRWLEREGDYITQTRSQLVHGVVIKDKNGKILYREPTNYSFTQYDRGGQIERNFGSKTKPDWRKYGTTTPSAYNCIKGLERNKFDFAYTKAYNALRSWNNDRVQLMVNLIEAHKFKPTLKGMVTDMENIVREDMKAIKRRKKALRKDGKYRDFERKIGGRVTRFLKRVGSVNLALNFGVMPLLYSLDSFKTTMKRSAFNRVTYRGQYNDNGLLKVPGFGFHEYKHKYHVTIDGYLIIENLEQALIEQILGNPLETAWEIIPYSWLVDYFTNFSDILINLTALTGYRFDGYITKYAVGDGLTYITNEVFRVSRKESVQKLMIREKVTSLPTPSLADQLVFVINPFDGHFNRVRELTSVLIQRLGRK